MQASLDDDQRSCVRTFGEVVQTRATLVVKAGAGSGKTHTLAHIIASHPGALAISHTRVACDAIQQRAESLSTSYDAHVGTIHAIARRLVGDVDTLESVYPESGVDFEQMLVRATAMLKSTASLPEWLASRRYIVVDEFQDTGTVQNTLVHHLRRRMTCALAVVGDFAQAIYGFQDATSEHMNLLRMRTDCVDVTLRNNYRSDHNIVEHANRLAHASNGGIHGAIRMRPTRHPAPRPETAASWKPLQLRCYRTDVHMVHAIVRWICDRSLHGLLYDGDKLTLYPSTNEARDYAHRRLRLTCDEGGRRPPDGTVVTLTVTGSNRRCPLPLGALRLTPSVTGRYDLSDMVVYNSRRRVLVACRKVAGSRQILNEVYTSLVTKERVDPTAIFITDRDNKIETNASALRMRRMFICLCTVHGTKGEEWDSVLHVDIGENLRRFSYHDEEEHRILYVSHTRAIDELWHMAVCVPDCSSLTRYMTAGLVSHFQNGAVRDTWEEDAPASVPPVFFDSALSLAPETHDQIITVTEFAEHTRTAWKPTEVRPPVHTVVWERTPKLCRLPNELHVLNAAHGLFLEWLSLWYLHEDATRHNALTFLQAVLRQYSVNRAFAIAMQFVFDNASTDEKRDVRNEFDRLRTLTDDRYTSSASMFDVMSSILHRIFEETGNRPALHLGDVNTAMNNVRMQQFVRVDPAYDACPVRQTIRHFDSHTGVDSWKMDDVPTLKPRVVASCRAVYKRGSRASVRDKFVCLLFMQSVNMVVEDGKFKMASNEQAWRILITVLRDDTTLQSYVDHVSAQLDVIREDALSMRNNIDSSVTNYQTHAEVSVHSLHRTSNTASEYIVKGRADATFYDGVLEVTSRDTNFKTKVQQACIYASILDKKHVLNYYIEDRLLVRRTLTEDAVSFLQRSATDLLLSRGLPGSRERVDRGNMSSEWSITVRKRSRE